MDRREFLQQGAACAAAAALPFALKGRAGAGEALAGMEGGAGYFSVFGIDRALVGKALEMAGSRGGDFADIFFQHRLLNGIVLEDGKVNRAYAVVDLGAGIRVVKGDQTGYAFTEDLTKEALFKAAATAAVIADGKGPAGPAGFKSVSGGNFYKTTAGWENVEAAGLKPLLYGMNEKAVACDKRIKKVRVSFEYETDRILVADISGRWAEDCRPMGTTVVSCLAEQDGRREENLAHFAARTGPERFSVETLNGLAVRAAERTILLFDAVRPPPGEMPVVLSAGSSGILLHEAIGHGMEADFNRKNISIYADRMEKKIAEPFVSIVDDGTVTDARGSINVDDEGTPGQRTVLVENGILRSYMHDRISASHYKTAPTGNGRRESFRFRPIPRMRCTYMLNGPHKKDEIIASVKKGVYAVNFTNGQVQIGAGDFTFYIKTGYMIEDGKLTAPIKDTNIIGNGPKVLENVVMAADDMELDTGRWTCGKDGQSVPVSLGLPTVKVSSVTVGGVK
jgi:TldD protein